MGKLLLSYIPHVMLFTIQLLIVTWCCGNITQSRRIIQLCKGHNPLPHYERSYLLGYLPLSIELTHPRTTPSFPMGFVWREPPPSSSLYRAPPLLSVAPDCSWHKLSSRHRFFPFALVVTRRKGYTLDDGNAFNH